MITKVDTDSARLLISSVSHESAALRLKMSLSSLTLSGLHRHSCRSKLISAVLRLLTDTELLCCSEASLTRFTLWLREEQWLSRY